MVVNYLFCRLVESQFAQPVDGDGQQMKDGGRAAEDVAGGPHITEIGPKGPLHAYLKRKRN